MFCRKCGQQISETESFCITCGEAVLIQKDSVKPEMMNVPVQQIEPSEEVVQHRMVSAPIPKKKHTRRTVLIIAGCVLAVCAVLVPVLINANLSDRYEKASDLLDSGDAEEAKTVFLELGSFEDAKDKVLECDYDSAEQMMDGGSFVEAKAAFAALGDYEDADVMAQECQNTLDYNEAVALKDGGDNEKARDIFLSLGSFEDAEAKALECQNLMDYNYAMDYMKNADYEEAKTVFDSLGSFLDAEQLSAECGQHVDYYAADWSATSGNFYNAYLQFLALGDFKDSADRALACIQPNPENAELYRNPDFSKKTCALTIKLGDKGSSLYMKIYSEDDVLVSTVFLNAGQKIKIKLPTGSYRFKAAFGTDWFGETDMFGDVGYYELIIFDDGAETWSLSSRYIYTLSMLQDETGNLNGTEIGPEGF